jgi:type VI protein secretion system component VasK
MEQDGGRPAPPSSNPLEVMIEREARFETRVRRVATVAWAGTFTVLPILGACMYVIDQRAGSSVEVARSLLAVFGLAGMLTLLLSLLTTIAWLFRSRSASLAAIDRRLAALEQLLSAQPGA